MTFKLKAYRYFTYADLLGYSLTEYNLRRKEAKLPYDRSFALKYAHAFVQKAITDELVLPVMTRRGIRWFSENDIEVSGPPLAIKVKEFYRISMVKMYYASFEQQKKTPTPFAEFRVIKYLDRPPTDKDEKDLDDALNRLEWIFQSIWFAKRQGKMRTEIDGLESEKISEGEVRGMLNQIVRYVAFFKQDGTIKADYDESEIARIEAQRSAGYKEWAGEKGVRK
jgi:hypothetical protein